MFQKKKSRLFLAIDQGGHASRALVFDEQGKLVAKSSCALETKYPKRAWVEQDAEDLLDSVKEVIFGAVEQLGAEKHRICSAGLATQRASVVCWNRVNGIALSKVLSWQDRRSAGWMQAFSTQSADIHARTGLFPSPHYGAGKLRWCLDNLPVVQKTLNDGELVLGPLASFIAARITEEGNLFVDATNASRTLLLDIKTGEWDHQLLEYSGIPFKALPQCVPSRFLFGHMVISKQRIPLTLVTGDQSAALFHDGPPREENLHINLGTGAFLQRIQKDEAMRAPRLLSSIVLFGGGQNIYALEGTVNGAGSALAYFAKRYHAHEWPQHAEAWLQKTIDPPLFINAIGGIASPFWVPCLESRFIGNGDIEAKFTAVIESILFLIQANLDEMNTVIDPPTRIILSGGISHLNTFCQKIANLSAIPVERPDQKEASSRGLAYLLTKSTSPWPTPSDVTNFRPIRDKPLQKRYVNWRQCLAEAIDSL